MSDDGVGPGGPVGTVRVERHPVGEGSGWVAELVLDRPRAMNALSAAFAGSLRDAAGQVAVQDGVRAVVLSSSSGRAFCVGADLKERDRLDDAGLRAQRAVMRAAFRAVLDLPVPAVAAVDGHALGGGLELALSCDLVVLGDAAVVGLPEVSVGVIPGGGGTQLLTRRVGWSRAADLVFTARRIGADEALRLGVADRVVPTGTARSAALELALVIGGHSPVGVRNAKRAMRLGQGLDLPAALDVEDAAWQATAFSADRAEGVRAFTEKRPPRWP